MSEMTTEDISRRLDDKTSVDAQTGCWLWQGATIPGGYGILRVGPRPVGVHRLSYIRHVGPIPDGLVLDHLCRTPPCLNPAHLEAVTQRVDFLRGQHPSAGAAREKKCKNGHPYEGNRYISPQGVSMCRPCRLANRAKLRARRMSA